MARWVDLNPLAGFGWRAGFGCGAALARADGDGWRTRGRRLTWRRRHARPAGLPSVHLNVVVSGPFGAAATRLPRLVARGCPVAVHGLSLVPTTAAPTFLRRFGRSR